MNDVENERVRADPRIICFENPEVEAAFDLSVARRMTEIQEASHRLMVSERNVMRMNHGRQWVHSAREPEPDTQMHSISAEWLIPFKDIADNDLGLIARTMHPVNEEMSRQFAQNMYGLVGAAAEKVGNVVDAQNTGSLAQSLLEMFRKVEFGVDRDGNVSMPQIHAGPEMADRLTAELQALPPEALAEIETIKAAKSLAALAREAERKSRFRKVSP